MSAHSVYIMRFLCSERVYNIRLFYFLIDCCHIWVHFPFPINMQASSVVWERQASYMSVEEEFYLRVGMLNDPAASCECFNSRTFPPGLAGKSNLCAHVETQ